MKREREEAPAQPGAAAPAEDHAQIVKKQHKQARGSYFGKNHDEDADSDDEDRMQGAAVFASSRDTGPIEHRGGAFEYAEVDADASNDTRAQLEKSYALQREGEAGDGRARRRDTTGRPRRERRHRSLARGMPRRASRRERARARANMRPRRGGSERERTKTPKRRRLPRPGQLQVLHAHRRGPHRRQQVLGHQGPHPGAAVRAQHLSLRLPARRLQGL